MPPRIRLRPRLQLLRSTQIHHPIFIPQTATYASVAHITPSSAPILHYPPTQPPSHKPAEVRKTQLHRNYQSLLKSSPLLLLFQHNNIKAVEWMSIRRELASALRKVDATREAAGHTDLFADAIKIQIVQTGIFASALRVVEFYKPEVSGDQTKQNAAGPVTSAWAKDDPRWTHGLSRHAYEVANKKGLNLELDPLLSGPMAVVSFPAVAPEYLKAVLSILSPSPAFPAPRRKEKPSYHDPSVQQGLQKLMLLAARVEGKVFDVEGTKWVGGIEGGLDGLRAQLVHMLQSAGAGVTNALEGVSRSLYFTMESRRMDMEEKEKPADEKKE